MVWGFMDCGGRGGLGEEGEAVGGKGICCERVEGK